MSLIIGNILMFLGGLGIFIFGMHEATEGLQKFAANRLKKIIKNITNNPWQGLSLGALLTVLFQSSTATTVLLVGLVSNGIMTLGQSLSIILGSAIGTSLTIQLISFNFTDYALGMVFLGSLLYLFYPYQKFRNLGRAFLGFGLIFTGLMIMSQAITPLKGSLYVENLLIQLSSRPLLIFLAVTILTGIMQSSAAMLAVFMSLAENGLVPVQMLIPVVMGAHLGGTLTALVTSIPIPNRAALRTGAANTIFKACFAVLVLIFYQPLTDLYLHPSLDLKREIANIHLYISLGMAVLYLPFCGLIGNLLNRMIPDKKSGDFELAYLDQNYVEMPAMAITLLKKEITRLLEILDEKMFSKIELFLEKRDEYLLEELAAAERIIDILFVKINRFVVNLTGFVNNAEENQEGINLLFLVKDIEHISNMVLSLERLGRKLVVTELYYPEDTYEDLKKIFAIMRENLNLTKQLLLTEDNELGIKIVCCQVQLERREKELRHTLYINLKSPYIENQKEYLLPLDMANVIKNINGYLVSMARTILKIY